nr:hypothetical protein CFP56_73880 [Quercus suber]
MSCSLCAVYCPYQLRDDVMSASSRNLLDRTEGTDYSKCQLTFLRGTKDTALSAEYSLIRLSAPSDSGRRKHPHSAAAMHFPIGAAVVGMAAVQDGCQSGRKSSAAAQSSPSHRPILDP